MTVRGCSELYSNVHGNALPASVPDVAERKEELPDTDVAERLAVEAPVAKANKNNSNGKDSIVMSSHT